MKEEPKELEDEELQDLINFSLNQASIEIYWITPEGRFVYTNEKARDRLGYSEDEIRKMHVWDIDPNHGKEIREKRWKMLEEERTMTFESEHETKDGEVYPVEITNHYIEYDGSEYEFAFAKDITERREAEERFRKVFEEMGDAVFVQSLESEDYADILEANPAAEDHTGYSREELIGMNLLEDIVIEPVSTSQEKIIDELRSGESISFVEKQQRKDGEERWVEAMVTPIEYKGEKASISINRDITERKEMEEKSHEREERFRKFFEESGDAVFITSTGAGEEKMGKIYEANPAAEEQTGYSREELIGMNISEDLTVHGSHSVDFGGAGSTNLDELDEELTKGEALKFMEKKRRKDGSEFWTEVMVAPIEYEGKKASLSINRDVTKRRELEERENFLHSLLRHDVRNKIQVIQGYLELLEDFDLPEGAKEYIKKAKGGGNESIELIEKVRTLRKAEEEETTKVDVSSTIQKGLDRWRSQAEDKNMEIISSCSTGELMVRGGSLLDRVFSNIVENSIQHSGGSKIKISEKIEKEEVTYIIEDDGKGIPQGERDNIFERGYTTDEERGSGLGMFLVKKLLDIYGGRIEIKDSELGGTRFDIHLRKA